MGRLARFAAMSDLGLDIWLTNWYKIDMARKTWKEYDLGRDSTLVRISKFILSLIKAEALTNGTTAREEMEKVLREMFK
jgi:hypothetical protein